MLLPVRKRTNLYPSANKFSIRRKLWRLRKLIWISWRWIRKMELILKNNPEFNVHQSKSIDSYEFVSALTKMPICRWRGLFPAVQSIDPKEFADQRFLVDRTLAHAILHCKCQRPFSLSYRDWNSLKQIGNWCTLLWDKSIQPTGKTYFARTMSASRICRAILLVVLILNDDKWWWR